jgi:hypothetical protein
MSEPTYQELLAERQQEWARAQAKAAADLKALHASIAKMPDVADAPAPGQPWGQPGIVCIGGGRGDVPKPCGSEVFHVSRWVTCNGTRHRAELRCLGCGRLGTWDWESMSWID